MKPPHFLVRVLLVAAALSFSLQPRSAQSAPLQTAPYAIGSPVLRDLYVDPVNGNDARSGSSRALALRTFDEAWQRVPADAPLAGTGWRICLMAGNHAANTLPNYLENRFGTAQFPVLVQSVDGRGRAVLQGNVNVFNCRYLYFVDMTFAPVPAADTMHFEKCDHILLRGIEMNGGVYTSEDQTAPVAYDNLKINQSQYVYLEECDVHGAIDNAVDYVAVQYGHAIRNRIHNTRDWTMYVKGGSANLTLEGNDFFGGGTGGFTAGQGAGFQFMTAPWTHYEAENTKFFNNIVHDCDGAGLGVNGGYNILMANNTLIRVGARSHMVEFVHGSRSCDGEAGDEGRGACGQNLATGGWGTTRVDDGTNYVRIPNRNVFFFNNLLFNPEGHAASQHFSIPGAYSGAAQAGSNAPNPAFTDTDLQIKGNLIWNGTPETPIGIEDEENSGCAASNPTCNATQIRNQNTINTLRPQLVNVAANNFHPAPGSNIAGAPSFAIPSFSGNDRAQPPLAPQGVLTNGITRDYDGTARGALSPGAFFVAPAPPVEVGFASPLNNARVPNLNSVGGFVRVGAGETLARVELAIERLSDHLFWTGTAWGAPTPLVTTTAGGNWSRNAQMPPLSLLPEGTYRLTALATTNSNRRHTAIITAGVNYVAPIIALSSPQAGAAIRNLATINGITRDGGTAGSGIVRVDLYLRRVSDNKYWNGSAWAALSAISTVLSGAPSNLSWTCNAALPTGANLVSGGYFLAARAFDAVGNGTSATANFIVDTVAPIIFVTNPFANSVVASFASASGSAADNAMGSGVVRVVFYLQRLGDGKWWNGNAWIAPLASLDATLGNQQTTWSVGAQLPQSANLVDGNYRIGVVAFDRAGNSGNNNAAFTLRRTAARATGKADTLLSPVVLSTALANSNGTISLTFTGALNASASDIACYAATQNGEILGLQSARRASPSMVEIAAGDFATGATIVVAYDIQDAQNRAIIGQTNVVVR